MNANSVNDTALSAEARERLARFADWTKTTPPKMILDADGAPTAGFLEYCVENGLSLDWVFTGDDAACDGELPSGAEGVGMKANTNDTALPEQGPYALEYALNEMQHMQATLNEIRWDLLAEMGDGYQLAGSERDAIAGAITAMGWAVERVNAAWEAKDRATTGGAA